MNILRLDVQDGGGPVSVVVQNEIEEMRLRDYFKMSLAAIIEKEERETEEQS